MFRRVGSNVDAGEGLQRSGHRRVILDSSHSRRGIVSTVENQDQLHSLAMMVDAYRRARYARVASTYSSRSHSVMGFSKGCRRLGLLRRRALRTTFRQHKPGLQLHSACTTSPCQHAIHTDTKVSQMPIRLYHGIADDYVSIAPVPRLCRRLKAAGATLRDQICRRAHAFDVRHCLLRSTCPRRRGRYCRLRRAKRHRR